MGEQVADLILSHYDEHARDLPWRIGPKSPKGSKANPYHVWLSEIMLQQTTVAAVIPYFEKFTARWPNFHTLANAQDEEVMAAWAGLGYYARARNLLKCARIVSQEHGGDLPKAEKDLIALPGIGEYTAAAIASIAFAKRALVLDANIERVMARLCQISTPLPRGKVDIKAALEQVVPKKRAGDFAQAMMDIGASVCSVKKPKCNACPIAVHCKAAKQGDAEAYPVKAPKKAKPIRDGMAWWIVCDKHVLLVQRPDGGMLGGMRALPDDGWNARQDGDNREPFTVDAENIVKKMVLNEAVQHSFTHFSLKLKLTLIEVNHKFEIDDAMKAIWWPIENITEAGLPTLFAKASQMPHHEG